MKLSEIKKKDSFIYLERYVNSIKKKFNEYSDVDARYSPMDGKKSFILPELKLKWEEVRILMNNPSRDVLKEAFCKGYVRFFIHPSMEVAK